MAPDGSLMGTVRFTYSLQGVTTTSDYSMSQILDFKEPGAIFHPVALLAYSWTNCPGQPQRREAEI